MDCGAYTGDTLQEFIDAGFPPNKYFGFEPDSENFKKARERLSESGIDGALHNVAVYKENCTLCFSANNDSGGFITEDGNISVEALSIDKTIKEPVTFIKMDIEGSEYQALEGAASVIKEYKPKLAICIYHKIEDYRAIPLLIKRLNPDYSEFYIRYLSMNFSAQLGFKEVVLFVR